jgi:hypothetical protein
MVRVLQIFRLEATEIVKVPARTRILRQRKWPGADCGWPFSLVPNHAADMNQSRCRPKKLHERLRVIIMRLPVVSFFL